MFTVRQTVENLLRLCDPEQRTIPAARTEDDPIPHCLAATMGGLSELGTLGPLWQFRRRMSAVIYAPVTITIPTIAEDASSFTLATPTWKDWMKGCSIKIGSEPWNEIIGRSGTTVQLLNPVITSHGSNVSATIYGDCVQLPTNVLQVLSPVSIADGYDLAPASNLSHIQQAVYDYWPGEDYGFRFSVPTNSRRRTADSPGPRLYWHDTQFLGETTAAESRLRLGPMPIAKAILNYRARLSTPRCVLSDVYTNDDVSADPGTVIPVRDDLIETVFLPIVRQRFTAAPIFRNDAVLPEFRRQYEAALEIAKKMKPQTAQGGCVQPGY